jgi:hypothetical protein
MSLFKRLVGVFSAPRQVFEALAEKPVWVDVLIIILAALIAHSLLVAPYAQKDQLELMRDNVKLRERLGDEAFDRMIANTENPSPGRLIVQTFVTMPLFAFAALLIQALFLIVLGRFVSTHGRYVQVLAALVHAGLIDKVLGNAVRLAAALARKSVMQTSTNLALLFPRMEVTSTAYAVLGQVDLFQLWMFGILAFGLSAIFKIELKKALVLSYGLWLLKALVNILLAVIGMSFLR